MLLLTTPAIFQQQAIAQAIPQTIPQAATQPATSATTPSAPEITGGTCPTDHYDETVTVQSVHDGDTVRLKDGRKIRLIGINTPELADNHHPVQPFAIAARDRLLQQINQHNNTVKLLYGKERQDHYKRTLAHLFLPDGTNLQADLLEHGLATANTHPPNDSFSDCYHRVEKIAHCKKSRIWSEDSYTVRHSADLDKKSEGFHILNTRVQRISKSDKAIHLFLDGGVLVSINTPDQHHFEETWLRSLVNRPVIVRGWLHAKKRAKKEVKFYMRIRHPSAIEFPIENNKKHKC